MNHTVRPPSPTRRPYPQSPMHQPVEPNARVAVTTPVLALVHARPSTADSVAATARGVVGRPDARVPRPTSAKPPQPSARPVCQHPPPRMAVKLEPPDEAPTWLATPTKRHAPSSGPGVESAVKVARPASTAAMKQEPVFVPCPISKGTADLSRPTVRHRYESRMVNCVFSHGHLVPTC
jgi:hypothetical protein